MPCLLVHIVYKRTKPVIHTPECVTFTLINIEIALSLLSSTTRISSRPQSVSHPP